MDEHSKPAHTMRHNSLTGGVRWRKYRMAGASHAHKGLSQGAWATHLDKLTMVDGLAKQVTHRCNLSR